MQTVGLRIVFSICAFAIFLFVGTPLQPLDANRQEPGAEPSKVNPLIQEKINNQLRRLRLQGYEPIAATGDWSQAWETRLKWYSNSLDEHSVKELRLLLPEIYSKCPPRKSDKHTELTLDDVQLMRIFSEELKLDFLRTPEANLARKVREVFRNKVLALPMSGEYDIRARLEGSEFQDGSNRIQVAPEGPQLSFEVKDRNIMKIVATDNNGNEIPIIEYQTSDVNAQRSCLVCPVVCGKKVCIHIPC